MTTTKETDTNDTLLEHGFENAYELVKELANAEFRLGFWVTIGPSEEWVGTPTFMIRVKNGNGVERFGRELPADTKDELIAWLDEQKHTRVRVVEDRDLRKPVKWEIVNIGDVEQCEECDGDGSQECDLGHEHDCEECDGEGEIVAEEYSKTVEDSGFMTFVIYSAEGIVYTAKYGAAMLYAGIVEQCAELYQINIHSAAPAFIGVDSDGVPIAIVLGKNI